MKIEVAPERDGRVVITIIPEEGSVPEVRLAEKPSPQPKEEPKPEKAEEVITKDIEAIAQDMQNDPHTWEEIEKAVKAKEVRRATEKQIRYFHLLARKAGIKDTQAWLEENGFPLPYRIVFKVEGNIVLILGIIHRKEAYQDINSRL